MLNGIKETVAGEQNAVMDDEVSQVHRRYTNLSEKIHKLRERANRAVQLRESYWTHRSLLETCLENCRHELSSVDSDDVDVSTKRAQLEASYYYLLLGFIWAPGAAE